MSQPSQQQTQSSLSLVFLDIRFLAVIGFVFGVLFHVWVVFSVLEDSSEPDNPVVIPVATEAVATPTPDSTVLPDRTDCDEIRGTQYRSASERQYFLETCI